MKNLKCVDLIQQKFQDRNDNISDIFQLKNDYQEYETSYEAFVSFGLSVDYIEPNTFEDQKNGYIRYQLSYGGPSDELRFYIDDATEHEEFDLYSLGRKEFARLFLFLNKEELLDKNTAEKLKEKTKFHEEDITKKLYI